MSKVIFKIEKTEKGIEAHIDGHSDELVNMLANAFINQPLYAAMVSDAQVVALKELVRRDDESKKAPKSKIIGLNG